MIQYGIKGEFIAAVGKGHNQPITDVEKTTNREFFTHAILSCCAVYLLSSVGADQSFLIHFPARLGWQIVRVPQETVFGDLGGEGGG